jgi:apolipoprotein N-acyltransferase
MLDMEQEGVIDHALPPARAATPYSRWGDWTLLLLLVALAGGAAFVRPHSAAYMR